jgi:hypothetical protein
VEPIQKFAPVTPPNPPQAVYHLLHLLFMCMDREDGATMVRNFAVASWIFFNVSEKKLMMDSMALSCGGDTLAWVSGGRRSPGSEEKTICVVRGPG